MLAPMNWTTPAESCMKIRTLCLRRLRPTATALLVALAAFGCGSAFHQPEVRLDAVQLGGLGLRGGTLLVELEVVNPNRFALTADQLHYTLALADIDEPEDTVWHDFASGTFDERFSVPARDTGRVQIPVSFSYSGVSSAALSLLRQGTFNYRASGSVDVRTPLGTHEVPFRRRGAVTLLGSR